MIPLLNLRENGPMPTCSPRQPSPISCQLRVLDHGFSRKTWQKNGVVFSLHVCFLQRAPSLRHPSLPKRNLLARREKGTKVPRVSTVSEYCNDVVAKPEQQNLRQSFRRTKNLAMCVLPFPVPLAAYSLFSQVDEYRRSRARPPRGFYDMLPPPPASGPSPPAMSYVIVGPRVRGKFDVQKSIALGVPQGPLRGQLTKGQTITFTVEDTVTSEDGTSSTVPRTVTVKPEECMGESEPPTAVIVLDVPSPEYIASLLQYYRNDFDPLFSKLRSTDPEHRKEVQVRVLFHLVGEGVLEDPRYIDFMRGFGDDAQVNVLISKVLEAISQPISSLLAHCRFQRALPEFCDFHERGCQPAPAEQTRPCNFPSAKIPDGTSQATCRYTQHSPSPALVLG